MSDVQQRIHATVTGNPVVLYMKGDARFPQCGFSATVVQILKVCTDFDTGLCTFDTVKPGAVVGRNGRLMAPHINLWIVARGINIGLNTRMYFSYEEEANANDPVLNGIEWEVRRKTLIGQREASASQVVYRFDIYLQGPEETVFFDI